MTDESSVCIALHQTAKSRSATPDFTDSEGNLCLYILTVAVYTAIIGISSQTLIENEDQESVPPPEKSLNLNTYYMPIAVHFSCI